MILPDAETVAATLSLAAAAGRRWDAVVVGAGPGGTLAARELARRGLSVLLVERAQLPRWKVCGCCINGSALATLAAVGLGDLVAEQGGIEVRGLELGAAGIQAAVPLAAERALSRLAFDAALARAAIAAGSAFLPGTVARLGELTSTSREVRLRQGSGEVAVHASVVIAADGLGCRLLQRPTSIEPGSRLGAGVVVASYPEFYRPHRIFMACGTGGYVGLVRVEDGRLNLAAAFDPHAVKNAGGVGALAAAILEESGFPAIADLADAPWQGTPLLTRRPGKPAAERIFLVGDAAGYVEPFTGEGMAWALACGRAVAPLARQAVRKWEPTLARRWARIHRDMITRRQWVIRSLAFALRSPLLARAVVHSLARVPRLASPIVRYLDTLPAT